jgi:hypothetical protein
VIAPRHKPQDERSDSWDSGLIDSPLHVQVCCDSLPQAWTFRLPPGIAALILGFADVSAIAFRGGLLQNNPD